MQEELAADPDFLFGYANLVSAYYYLNRFADSKAMLKRAADRKLSEPTMLKVAYNIALLEGDREEANRIAAVSRGQPDVEHSILHQDALALARVGQLEAARRASSRAIDVARQEKDRDAAAAYQAARAAWEPPTETPLRQNERRRRRSTCRVDARSSTRPLSRWRLRETPCRRSS